MRLLSREDVPDERKKMLMGEEGENRFNLVKTEVLGDKSLLQYIVDNGPKMMKQREDLLDVSSFRDHCQQCTGGETCLRILQS